jgi:hypothetical protein
MKHYNADSEQQCSFATRCGYAGNDRSLTRPRFKLLKSLLFVKSLLYASGSIILLLSSVICTAQNIRVLAPDNDRIIIHGRIGDDSSFSKRISLISDQTVPELIVRPGDLDRDGGGGSIARTQVQTASSNKVALVENTPYDLDFKVTGVKVPGSYNGALYFLLPKHGTTDATHVSVQVIADSTSKLQVRKGSESVKVQIVDCSHVGCLLSSFLDPAALRSKYAIPFDNSDSGQFLVDGSLAASGEHNWGEVTGALTLGLPTTVPAKPIITIPLTVSNTHLTPDHYVGDIQLRTPGQDMPLKVPLEVNVKSGPVVPILVLLIGVLTGRLVKYMKDKGTPQADLLLQLHQLEMRASQSPTDEYLVRPNLDTASLHIKQMQLSDAQADLAKVASLLTLLARLRYLEMVLEPRQGEAPVAAILALIAQARGVIGVGGDPTSIATQIETSVNSLPAPTTSPGGTTREMTIARSVSQAVVGVVKPQPATKRRGVRAVAFLTGYDESARAEVTLWFLRPLLWLLLLAALLIVGLQQLYLKDPSFGSAAFSDYFGLFVWATSADVASRTISTLR